MEPIIETHKRKYKERLNEIVAGAARMGLVVTIEQVSRPPFAMGEYDSVVSVREDKATRKSKEAKAS